MGDKRAKTRTPAAVFALCTLVSGCAQDRPEDRIRAAIAEMEAAIEAREPGGFLAHVTDDFSGADGAFHRSSLRGYLATLLVGNQLVEVTLGPASIAMHGEERATVKIDAFVIGGARLPERGEHLDITSGWRLDDGEWKVYVASWE